MFGNRALYHDGWMASTVPYREPWNGTAPSPKDIVNGIKWELFDLSKDWTQNNDVAAANPGQTERIAGHVLDRGGKVSGACRSMLRH